MDVTNAARPGCLQTTLKILGDKWTARILGELTGGPLTFSALEKTLDHISPRTLSQRLDMLEGEEIIEKRLYCQHPPRYKYVLSAKGDELHEIIDKMADWGARHQVAATSPLE